MFVIGMALQSLQRRQVPSLSVIAIVLRGSGERLMLSYHQSKPDAQTKNPLPSVLCLRAMLQYVSDFMPRDLLQVEEGSVSVFDQRPSSINSMVCQRLGSVA